jgi:phosphoribosylformylglycinamidine synthase subunit PurQ / glutaminase
MIQNGIKFGVVVFPGSNCDHDAYYACKKVMGQQTEFLWHKEADLHDVDVVILPGGFSYGDYLRCGAIARFSPVMKEVVRFAQRGGLVLGICNGFQILLEAGLLPGVLLRNASLRFVCREINIRVENEETAFTRSSRRGDVLAIPVAHGDGNYFADADTIKRLEEHSQVVFRYCTQHGEITDEANPNGSLNNIAGIVNERGNVLGMMPHPERAADPLLGRVDGQKVFHSLLEITQSSLLAAESGRNTYG